MQSIKTFRVLQQGGKFKLQKGDVTGQLLQKNPDDRYFTTTLKETAQKHNIKELREFTPNILLETLSEQYPQMGTLIHIASGDHIPSKNPPILRKKTCTHNYYPNNCRAYFYESISCNTIIITSKYEVI